MLPDKMCVGTRDLKWCFTRTEWPPCAPHIGYY